MHSWRRWNGLSTARGRIQFNYLDGIVGGHVCLRTIVCVVFYVVVTFAVDMTGNDICRFPVLFLYFLWGNGTRILVSKLWTNKNLVNFKPLYDKILNVEHLIRYLFYTRANVSQGILWPPEGSIESTVSPKISDPFMYFKCFYVRIVKRQSLYEHLVEWSLNQSSVNLGRIALLKGFI